MLSKSKNLVFSVIPFLLVWSVDRFTKMWAEAMIQSREVGFLKFELVYNNGIMLGMLSHLPHNIKATALVTLGALVLSSYILCLVVVPIKSYWLRVGLSLLTAGIIGNVTDRLIGDAVVDFFSFQIGTMSSPYYNLADVFQWFSYAFIIFGIYQDSQYFWPSQDWRNKNFINPSFQLRVGILSATTIFLVSFIFIIFGTVFFKDTTSSEVLNYFLLIGFAISSFLSLVGFIGGVTLSHRVAGPVYALEKYINASLNGEEAAFKLRDNDEFKELEEIYTRLNQRIKRN
jgi:signal peptidase II